VSKTDTATGHSENRIERIFPKVWNRILVAAGLINITITPFGFVSIITGLINQPWYIAIFNLLRQPFSTGEGAGIMVVIIFTIPLIAITYTLLYREETHSAISLGILTALNFITSLFLFFVMYLFSLAPP
jgi:hypothetical protein